MTDEALTKRVLLLEKRLDIAINAIHLLTASAKPTSEWLDSKLAAVEDAS